MPGNLHIIGGGLAGLSAAVEAAGCGKHVILHEAAGQCGGRARSYYDAKLGHEINNGNHLFFTSNKYLLRFIEKIGSLDTIDGPKTSIFPFYDNKNGDRWCVHISESYLPYWLLSHRRRVRGMTFKEILSLLRLLHARKDQTVSEFLDNNPLSRRFLVPLAVSILNTMPQEGSAHLLATVFKETLVSGENSALPRFTKKGLSETFVKPALHYLDLLNAEVKLGHCLTSISSLDGRISSLHFGKEEIKISPDDRVIMATPPHVAYQLLKPCIPGFTVPNEFESIANLHFKPPMKLHPISTFEKCRFLAVIGGLSEWIFIKNDILSVTISAANRYRNMDHKVLVEKVWNEVRNACSIFLQQPLPKEPQAYRLVWEKRATFKASPRQEHLRLGAATPLVNLALCGDWTYTTLPSTLEGAVYSGVKAVEAVGLKQAV